MHDPFKITGPTCISFSGGRTSGYMLWMVLEANGGLPADCHVVFANTGKEDEATLRFVRDCAVNWNVPIVWVEYLPDGDGWRQVTFETASRDGEPFAALIQKRNYLPNPVARFCTVELKILRIADYMRHVGHDEFDVFVGIRADEPARVATLRANPSGGSKGITRLCPLADAKVTKREVGAFWKRSNFDLQLPLVNGKTIGGNCDLCFLKHSAMVMSLISENPSRAVWWAKQEGSISNANMQNGGTFRSDRPSYAQMLAFTQSQADAFGYAAAGLDDGIECVGCTD